MSSKVKGAGDTTMRENPRVHSKGQRHGIPYHPEPVSHPGGVSPLPVTGTKIPLHNENGHQEPREVPHAKERHVVNKVAPPKTADSGALDRASYAGKYPGDKT